MLVVRERGGVPLRARGEECHRVHDAFFEVRVRFDGVQRHGEGGGLDDARDVLRVARARVTAELEPVRALRIRTGSLRVRTPDPRPSERASQGGWASRLGAAAAR